jgi:hypothetical protein
MVNLSFSTLGIRHSNVQDNAKTNTTVVHKWLCYLKINLPIFKKICILNDFLLYLNHNPCF